VGKVTYNVLSVFITFKPLRDYCVHGIGSRRYLVEGDVLANSACSCHSPLDQIPSVFEVVMADLYGTITHGCRVFHTNCVKGIAPQDLRQTSAYPVVIGQCSTLATPGGRLLKLSRELSAFNLSSYSLREVHTTVISVDGD